MGLQSSSNTLETFKVGIYPSSAVAKGLLSGLLWYYKLDELSGTRDDSGTNNLDLTESGSVGTALGIISTSARFPGTANNLLKKGFVSQYNFSSTDFTWAGWFKINANNSNHMMIYIGTGGILTADRVIDFEYLTSSDTVRVTIGDGDAFSGLSQDVGGSIPVGTFVFFAIRWDTTTELLELRLNAQAFASATIFHGIQSSGTQNFTLGATDSGLFDTDGDLDELGGWDRKLTDNEINYLYNNGSANRPDF